MVARFVVFAASFGLLGVILAQHEPPLKVSPESQEQKLIRRTEVVYPRRALAARISGMVTLSVLIDENGRVRGVRLLNGHPLLVRAAMDAVKRWRYRPTQLGGRPVQVLTTVSVPFVLPDASAVPPPAGTANGAGFPHRIA